MNLYNIHTHTCLKPSDDISSFNILEVLNTYPSQIDRIKEYLQFRWLSCGVHPWYSDDYEKQLEHLARIVFDEKIVAIGEAGLDKLRGLDIGTQQEIFETQIELSERVNKPLIIHCVKAWDELISIKKKYKPSQPWILHGYRGKPDQTRQLLSHELMFSIGEKFNTDSLRLIPLDRLFCEVDDSDITIDKVYRNIVEVLEIDFQLLAEEIEKNVKRTFPLLTAR